MGGNWQKCYIHSIHPWVKVVDVGSHGDLGNSVYYLFVVCRCSKPAMEGRAYTKWKELVLRQRLMTGSGEEKLSTFLTLVVVPCARKEMKGVSVAVSHKPETRHFGCMSVHHMVTHLKVVESIIDAVVMGFPSWFISLLCRALCISASKLCNYSAPGRWWPYKGNHALTSFPPFWPSAFHCHSVAVT